MPPSKLKYRELMVLFISENRILYNLYKGNEKYAPLLELLIKEDIESDNPLPSQKELLKKIKPYETPTHEAHA